MPAVLLDTDVFSFVLKRDTRTALYAPDLDPSQLCLSFQSVAELHYWALSRNWAEPRRRALDAAMARCILLPYDAAMALRWAEITAHRRRIGRPIECGDAWIAATALRHGIPLATHNARDYEGIPGLQLICHSGTA